ncbi:hypothetical protein [Rhizobium tubonense]|uniref:Uncharacterized protein n=1 Tax=Rhizobium tubonense TaxID=484088 RepID=A0A2W4ES01_9HYPH|nr:hypothetical protein [Rhizobium tubonense]PZM13190.1 hypothetical protein CPY51_16955 [Rhizobium tubonense]
MVEVVNVSAYMAAWAADVAKPPVLVPSSIAARDARKLQKRQERDGATDNDIESPTLVIQSTSVALDLMTQGNSQPRSTLRHAIESYAEND